MLIINTSKQHCRTQLTSPYGLFKGTERVNWHSKRWMGWQNASARPNTHNASFNTYSKQNKYITCQLLLDSSLSVITWQDNLGWEGDLKTGKVMIDFPPVINATVRLYLGVLLTFLCYIHMWYMIRFMCVWYWPNFSALIKLVTLYISWTLVNLLTNMI